MRNPCVISLAWWRWTPGSNQALERLSRAMGTAHDLLTMYQSELPFSRVASSLFLGIYPNFPSNFANQVFGRRLALALALRAFSSSWSRFNSFSILHS
jgi:hypothetical protein